MPVRCFTALAYCCTALLHVSNHHPVIMVACCDSQCTVLIVLQSYPAMGFHPGAPQHVMCLQPYTAAMAPYPDPNMQGQPQLCRALVMKYPSKPAKVQASM